MPLFLPLYYPHACLGELEEAGEGCHMAGRKLKMTKSGRDMLETGFKPFLEAQKSIGPEGLHEALD